MHHRMKLLVLNALLVTVFYLGVTGAGKVADPEKPIFYRRWPACKKGLEYAQVIRKEDRVPGERYNELKKSKGVIKTYICRPCTRCASGVREISTCSIKADTDCSETECAVDGCIMDPMLASCMLPGDPNEYPSIDAMMDPCDPTKFTQRPALIQTTSAKAVTLGVAPVPNERKSLDATALSKKASSQDANIEADSGWDISDIVITSLLATGFVTVVLLFIFYKYRGRKNVKYRYEKCVSSPSKPSVGLRVETTV